MMGYLSKEATPNRKKLKIFKTPCILVSRNGYAGKMMYMENGEFTTNDHAYILEVRDEWKNRVNIRWFMYRYQELFYNLVTSKSDNATFNKESIEKRTVSIPNREFQDKMAERLFILDKTTKKLERLRNLLSDLIEEQIT